MAELEGAVKASQAAAAHAGTLAARELGSLRDEARQAREEAAATVAALRAAEQAAAERAEAEEAARYG